MHVSLPRWSAMFPGWHLLRAACPGLSSAACCLEAGTWALGPRNAHVQRALWHLCSFHDAHMFPYQEWRVECVPEADAAATDPGEAVDQGRRDPVDHTAAWLLALTQDEGEEALTRLLPYELLGVGEFAELDAAKAAFRRLSRHFQPDKNSMPLAAPIFEALRVALELIKEGGWRAKLQDSHTKRFFTDASVVELNRTAHATALQSDGPLWLVIYFAPWCHQCLANKEYYVLAAKHLLATLGPERVRIGAVRCNVERKPGGYCETELSVPEHPTFRAFAQGFATELGPSLPQPLLPELLVNFTIRAELELRQQRALHSRGATVRVLTPEHAASAAFVSTPQLVLFRSTNCSLCDLAQGAIAALGEPLLNVSVVHCEAEAAPAAPEAPEEAEEAQKGAYWFSHAEFPKEKEQQEEGAEFIKVMQQAQRDADWFSGLEMDEMDVGKVETERRALEAARERRLRARQRQARRGTRLVELVNDAALLSQLSDELQLAEEEEETEAAAAAAEAGAVAAEETTLLLGAGAVLEAESELHTQVSASGVAATTVGAAAARCGRLRAVDYQPREGPRRGYTPLLLACELGRAAV